MLIHDRASASRGKHPELAEHPEVVANRLIAGDLAVAQLEEVRVVDVSERAA
jgi:hypothetical protein